MATVTYSGNWAFANDTEWRSWGKGLSDALTAVGFVKSSDTGQVDWATSTKPATGSTYPVYEIRRLSDSLQSACPVYAKLEYGCDSGANRPATRLSVGKGSDGAGNLTGILVTPTAMSPAASSVSTTAWAGSGDGSMVHYTPPTLVTTGNMGFVIERSRTAGGTPTGTGLLTVLRSGASAPTVAAFNYATGTGLTQTRWPMSVPGAGATSLTSAGKVPAFAAVVGDGQGNWWQPRSILVAAQPDSSPLVPISVPGWNTYMATGNWTQMDLAASATVHGLLAWW